MHFNINQEARKAAKCAFKHWELVVDGDELNPQYNKALEHVELCTECQTRVERSANSDMPWWDEAKDSWLETE